MYIKLSNKTMIIHSVLLFLLCATAVCNLLIRMENYRFILNRFDLYFRFAGLIYGLGHNLISLVDFSTSKVVFICFAIGLSELNYYSGYTIVKFFSYLGPTVVFNFYVHSGFCCTQTVREVVATTKVLSYFSLSVLEVF